MEFEYIYPILILFDDFTVMLIVGVPITFTIGLSSLLSIIITLLPNAAVSTTSQEMTVGPGGFTPLATPFSVSAGNIMNTGGITKRLVNLAQALVGRLLGSLAHCNILVSTLFGAISGSAVTSAAAAGGIMLPLQEKEGYDPAFSTAVNITSAPIGLMVPPSNVLIVYSLAGDGAFVVVLFLARYLSDTLAAAALMFVATLYIRHHHYLTAKRISYRQLLQVSCESIPSLMLTLIIIGGIIAGVFTPIETSAIAVIYSLALAMIYRKTTLEKLNNTPLDSIVTSLAVLLLVDCPVRVSQTMTDADIPELINGLVTHASDNKWVILFITNIILLVAGTFMDITSVILISTPIFLSIVQHLGADPIRFGITMVFSLVIGLCVPPVGTILFVGCNIGKVGIDRAIEPLLPVFLVLFMVMTIVCYFPQFSLALPGLFST